MIYYSFWPFYKQKCSLFVQSVSNVRIQFLLGFGFLDKQKKTWTFFFLTSFGPNDRLINWENHRQMSVAAGYELLGPLEASWFWGNACFAKITSAALVELPFRNVTWREKSCSRPTNSSEGQRCRSVRVLTHREASTSGGGERRCFTCCQFIPVSPSWDDTFSFIVEMHKFLLKKQPVHMWLQVSASVNLQRVSL